MNAPVEVDSDDICPKCGGVMGWESCSECGGDGCVDRYEEDPLWYGHELYACSLCLGDGGWFVCPECCPREEAPR